MQSQKQISFPQPLLFYTENNKENFNQENTNFEIAERNEKMKNANWPENYYEEKKQVEDKLGQTEILLTLKSSKYLGDINKVLPLQKSETL